MKYFIISGLICFLMLSPGAIAVKDLSNLENGISLRKSKRIQVQSVAVCSPETSNGNGKKRKYKRKREKKAVTWAELPPRQSTEEDRPRKRRKSSSEDVSSMNVERTLAAKIESLQKMIALGHEEAKPSIIRTAGKRFEQLVHPDRKWETYARQLGAYRWPSQESWKEVVGGHLFFPQETFDWEEISCERYRLTRIDNLWAYAVAAKFKHAVGKYYLVRMLDKLRGIYYEERPKFFDRLYREAFGDLKQCEERPEACYIIGCNYNAGFPYLSSSYVEDEKMGEHKAIEWYLKGKDLRTQHKILMLRKAYPHFYGSVTAEEFLALARAGYSPAYREAYKFIDTDEAKGLILREAIVAGFKPALLWLGRHYRKRGDKEIGIGYYIRAGDEGVSRAYIGLGILKVGDLLYKSQERRKDLRNLTQDEIKEAIEWFTRAGEAHHPEGWDYLAKLYAELRLLKRVGKDDFKREYSFCLREGMKLGSKRAYDRSFKYFSERSVDRFRARFGERPHCELRRDMEKFLKDLG